MRNYLAAAAVAVLAFMPGLALAQDSVFKSYASYERFLDTVIMSRDFKQLIIRLGGRDEYTPEEMSNVERQLLSIYPRDFSGGVLAVRQELLNGFSREIRIFWDDKSLRYCYFYAFLHEVDGSVVVLKFDLNTNSDVIFGKL